MASEEWAKLEPLEGDPWWEAVPVMGRLWARTVPSHMYVGGEGRRFERVSRHPLVYREVLNDG